MTRRLFFVAVVALVASCTPPPTGPTGGGTAAGGNAGGASGAAGGTATGGGNAAGGGSPSGIPIGGSATLTGAGAFLVRNCRAYAKRFLDGGADYSRVAVLMSSVNLPCADPRQAVPGPGKAMALEAYSTDGGGNGKGVAISTGSNFVLVDLSADGGPPLDYQYAPEGASSSVTLDWGADPTSGVRGTLDVKFDGGAIQGTYAAEYCGAF